MNNAIAYSRRADTNVALGKYADALPDLEAAARIKPDDPTIIQNLQFVRAKLAPAAPAAAVQEPVATPTPVAKKKPTDPRVLIIGGFVGLIVLGLVIAIVVKMTRRSE